MAILLSEVGIAKWQQEEREEAPLSAPDRKIDMESQHLTPPSSITLPPLSTSPASPSDGWPLQYIWLIFSADWVRMPVREWESLLLLFSVWSPGTAACVGSDNKVADYELNRAAEATMCEFFLFLRPEVITLPPGFLSAYLHSDNPQSLSAPSGECFDVTIGSANGFQASEPTYKVFHAESRACAKLPLSTFIWPRKLLMLPNMYSDYGNVFDKIYL